MAIEHADATSAAQRRKRRRRRGQGCIGCHIHTQESARGTK
ncbi:MAG TPA: hypothetical protein PLB41_03840 [Rubrivivax sp.]|nr:hypothetical protein [Rubrivivax sp.]